MENNSLNELSTISDATEIVITEKQEKTETSVEISNTLPDSTPEVTPKIEVAETHHEEAELAAQILGRQVIKEKQDDLPEDMKDHDDDDVLQSGEPTAPEEDYSHLDKSQLIEKLRKLIQDKEVQLLKPDVESIKQFFYRKFNVELKEKREKFIAEGGDEKDFAPEPDQYEEALKILLKKFKEERYTYNQKIERDKNANLQSKLKIIEELKILVGANDSITDIGAVFNKYKELTKQWKEIGAIPQTEVKNVWQNYNFQLTQFHDSIKISQELHELDMKRNLEAKMKICEDCESLLIEDNVVKAFRALQGLHLQWREIGPFAKEKRQEVWERFKHASTIVNKRYQDHFEKLKQEEENNLNEKIMLCEKVEEISQMQFNNPKDWESKSDEVIELQKLWKTIGYAPKKDNSKVYQRFREACDKFFGNKRDFFEKHKENQEGNLQMKTELCIQAESLKDSHEWRQTSDEIIKLQDKWKTIGPVPRKVSDQLWKRFREACNAFFENKKSYFSNIDKEQDNNLTQKLELIKEIENFQPSENKSENLNHIKEFQRKWADIGHVPIKDKDNIQKNYRTALNKWFDTLNVEDNQKNDNRFKSKLKEFEHSPRSSGKFKAERDSLVRQYQATMDDILLLENNIGFFAKSKNAEVLINDIKSKIDKYKKQAQSFDEKIKMMDQMKDTDKEQ